MRHLMPLIACSAILCALFFLFGCPAGADISSNLSQNITDDLKIQPAVDSGDPGNCAKLGYLADECFARMAASRKEPAICARISYPLGRDGCYSDVAGASGLEADCKKVGDAALRNTCYKGAAVANRDGSICGKIANNARLQHECRFEVIVAMDDPALCAGFGSAEIPGANECYQRIAVKRMDVRICGKTKDRHYDDCVGMVAQEKRDAALCGSIADYEKAALCIQEIAKSAKDAAICSMIMDGNVADRCRYAIALEKGDLAICQNITDANLQKTCLWNVEPRNVSG